MQAGVVKPNAAALQQNQGVIDKEEEPWQFYWYMCWYPCCRKKSSCEGGCRTESWPPYFLSTLPVFVASLCPRCTQEEIRLIDSGFCSTRLAFLGVATVPYLPQGLRAFLHDTHMCLFPIHVLRPLRALTVFVFLKSVKFFLQISPHSLKLQEAQKTELAAKASGVGGAQCYRLCLLIRTAPRHLSHLLFPLTSVLESPPWFLYCTFSSSCLVFSKTFDMTFRSFLIARFVRCQWLVENWLGLWASRVAWCPTGGHLLILRDQNREQYCTT